MNFIHERRRLFRCGPADLVLLCLILGLFLFFTKCSRSPDKIQSQRSNQAAQQLMEAEVLERYGRMITNLATDFVTDRPEKEDNAAMAKAIGNTLIQTAATIRLRALGAMPIPREETE